MASPASSEVSPQAARPSVFWPLTATVAVIKAFAAIKGEGQPLTPVPGPGGTDPDGASGARPTYFSPARFDAPAAQEPDAGLPAGRAGSDSGEDTAPVAIEPLPEGQTGSGFASTAATEETAVGGTLATESAPGTGGARADARSAAPLAGSAGTGGGQAQPTQAAENDTAPSAVPDKDTGEVGADDEGGEVPPGRTAGDETAPAAVPEKDRGEGRAEPPADPLADTPPVPTPFLYSAGEDEGYGYTLIQGDGDDDFLVGTLRHDDMDGRGGDDHLRGSAGEDILRGGLGDDRFDGGEGDDSLVGGPDDDSLLGGRGDDRLEGGTGSDYLFGQHGDDALVGGFGRDELAGMEGADRFVLTAVADSPAYAPDSVLDFSAFERDTLDLSAIDANWLTPGDEAFTFIGQTDFSGTPGELRIEQQLRHITLEGDVDGDGLADLGIKLLGVGELNFDDVMG